MEKLMLKIVNAALEEDSIKNILKLDRETNTATRMGLCSYLVGVYKLRVPAMNTHLSVIQDYIYHGEFHKWLENNYLVEYGYLYPEWENWEERLIILEKFRDHLESLIKEKEL